MRKYCLYIRKYYVRRTHMEVEREPVVRQPSQYGIQQWQAITSNRSASSISHESAAPKLLTKNGRMFASVNNASGFLQYLSANLLNQRKRSLKTRPDHSRSRTIQVAARRKPRLISFLLSVLYVGRRQRQLKHPNRIGIAIATSREVGPPESCVLRHDMTNCKHRRLA
jgi:hypothetical protein